MASENSPESSAKSLLQKFFGAPFLSLTGAHRRMRWGGNIKIVNLTYHLSNWRFHSRTGHLLGPKRAIFGDFALKKAVL